MHGRQPLVLPDSWEELLKLLSVRMRFHRLEAPLEQELEVYIDGIVGQPVGPIGEKQQRSQALEERIAAKR